VLTCQIVGTATLGDAIEITGEEVGGYVPVVWQGREAWAYRLFLNVGDEPAELIRSGVPGCNRVALIFNAGIGDAPSETILDTLVSTQAPVTLFAMGWWADAYPDYLSRFANDTNAVVGSHGDTQLFLTGASDERIANEVRESEQSIQQVLGYPPARYYTPYATDTDGRVQHVISREGYLPVAWTVSAADYTDAETADEVYSRVMGSVSDGAIIELHLDGPATDRSTAVALPGIIRDLQAQGYQLVTIPEILLPCPSMP
jgi:peptidoglycan/xylan/chitin deacetylase (PgdA/CDA1 family)